MDLICEQVAKDNSLTGKSETDSAELSYIVIGTNDIDEGRAAVLSKVPSNYLGCALSSVSVDRQEGQVIYYRASYAGGSFSNLKEDEPTISFNMSQGTATIKRAYEQKKYGSDAPDAGLAVGWNGKTQDESEVAGVDIPVCTIRKTFSRIVKTSELDVNWERLHAKAFGRVNMKPFGDYKAGEVLFLGCSYSGLNSDVSRLTVSYDMAIAFNESNVSMGTDTKGKEIKISKYGWAYVWEILRAKQEQNSGIVPPKLCILGVYVSSVYRLADFSIFGLDI